MTTRELHVVDVVGANTEPDDVHVAGMRRRAICKECAAVWRLAKLEDALPFFEAFNAQARPRGTLRLQVLHEAAYGGLEAPALRRAEAPPVAKKILVCLIRRHYLPLPSDGISSRAAINASMLSCRVFSLPAARASASSRPDAQSAFCRRIAWPSARRSLSSISASASGVVPGCRASVSMARYVSSETWTAWLMCLSPSLH